MSVHKTTTALLAVFFLLGLGLAGCGSTEDGLHPVTGKVTFQGKPVAGGQIRFRDAQAGIDMVANLSEAAYAATTGGRAGLPEGTYGVAILPPRWDMPMVPPGEQIRQPAQPPPCLDIPARYRQLATSGLELTVQPGENVFDVDMRP